ncbi:uncharacterized protein EHS24_007018 [Apiotrichum porosum]|uniref:Nudix hydrolase domain-containing protein n=1 Tax=Apiotrichum porosum TaxID=105984 RepID=A0A427XWX1_9TREE|nr:uncharacterized protein EHS24_007018 [Apiotrichum porosum]RSH83340.1 hypothetical protein EHS24_007018 [Apiotrichum porosum]
MHPRDVALAVVFLPKGGVEKGETSGQAAAREANEEAGVPAILAAGAISPLLVKHTLQHVPKNKRQEVWHAHAILLLEESELLDEWDEAKDRKREWVTPREAMERIREWAPLLDDVPAEPSDEDMKRGGIKKKAVKRFAMEVCLAAFVEQYGWDKKV